MFNFSLTFKKAVAALFLIPLLCTPFGMIALTPQPAYAQGMVVNDPLNFVQNKASALMNSISAATLKSLGLKEWALDGVLFALAKKVLQQMVRSTISWINSGFKGSPMYIQNPEQFLTNIGDEIAGEIIYGSDLNFLCSPINIRASLEFYYKTSRQRKGPQCTLSGVVRNVDQFMEGNFLAGGWPGWLSVSITPTNQPVGGLLAAVGTLETSVGAAQAGQVMRLNWGKGFLSWEECTDPQDKNTCKIVTPGSTIADALSFELSVGSRTLIEADEINEIIGALFAQLGNQALASLRGVNGLSRPSSSFGGGGVTGGGGVQTGCAALSYLDQLNDPSCNPSLGGTSTSTSGTNSETFIQEALTSERDYQALYRGIVNNAQEVMDHATESSLTCRANQRAYDDAREIRDDATEKVDESILLVAKLISIEGRYVSGTNDVQVAAINEYVALEGSGALHSDVDNALEGQKIDDLEGSLATIRSRVDTCRSDDDEDETS